MSTKSHSHHEKKGIFEYTPDEGASIKMLKANNKETITAIMELDEGRGTRSASIDDFWEQMGMDPNA